VREVALEGVAEGLAAAGVAAKAKASAPTTAKVLIFISSLLRESSSISGAPRPARYWLNLSDRSSAPPA